MKILIGLLLALLGSLWLSFGAVTPPPSSSGGGITQGQFNNALTNNDVRTGGANFAEKLFVTPGGGLDPISLGAGGGGGSGFYGFANTLVFMGAGYYFNGQNNTPSFGAVDSAGNWSIGGPGYNNNKFYAQYLVGSAGMMTNQMPTYDQVDYLYPVPVLCAQSYYNMPTQPNGAWATNTMALLNTVAPGWYNTGWSNIWYDQGMLTNRISGHLTNNSAAFPQGITGIVTYAHSQGFNIGTYVAHGQQYCSGLPGQPTTDEFIFQDLLDIGAMGFDMLKVDNCGTTTPYQGLTYDVGGTHMTRHYFMFPEANMFMSRQLDRKPLYMDTTEVANISTLPPRGSWHPNYTLTGFNAYENASPLGNPAVFGGSLTNFVFEMQQFHEHRPGHFFRCDLTGIATAAVAKEGMSLAALAPASVFLPNTNLVGNATLSPFLTNGLVNGGLIMHPLGRPGFIVISNSANHVVVWARPLGPPNGRVTGSAGFNNGAFPTGLAGYPTFGTDGTNVVGLFNIDASGHTQVINVKDVGMASNAPVQVFDVWNGGSLGYFVDQWTSPTIAAGTCEMYLFVPVAGAFASGYPLGTVWSSNTGGQALPAATTAYYAAEGNGATNIAVTDVSSATRNVTTRDLVLGRLFVTRDVGGGAGNTTTVTVMTNGTASSIVASLNNATAGNDTTHFVPVPAGTQIGIKIVTPAGDTPGRHSWSFEGN